MTIKLEDCKIWSKLNGWEDFRNIHFSLPGIINLYGIKKEINNYQVGHERFENSAGVLTVACDFCARYFPREESIHGVGNSFEFRSVHGLSEFRAREFRIEYVHTDATKIIGSDGKDEIIKKIELHKNMRPYLNSFFDWLNEFKNVYGEKFYFE